MMKNKLSLFILLSFLFQHCLNDAPSKKGSKSIDHEQWTILLQKYVDQNGMVDYKGFQKDSINLISYLNELSANPPDETTWSDQEQIAYWLNAYNGFTIKLIIDHYPLESIKDIGPAIQIPFINSPWDIRFIGINGKKLDLNNIEHSILRKKFNEPRIHFAINCASISCPRMRREAYSEDKLDVQLNEQAVDFINDPQRNIINSSQAEVSKIFDWFKGDFTKNGSLKDFLNQYAKIKIAEDVKISYNKYDWSLNEISSISK